MPAATPMGCGMARWHPMASRCGSFCWMLLTLDKMLYHGWPLYLTEATCSAHMLACFKVVRAPGGETDDAICRLRR
jgi:hypothetical protein